MIGDVHRRLPGVANLLILTDTEDGGQTDFDRHSQLAGHEGVRLAEQISPFGVTDDDELGAAVAHHEGGYFAGEGPGALGGAVLP